MQLARAFRAPCLSRPWPNMLATAANDTFDERKIYVVCLGKIDCFTLAEENISMTD